MKKNFMHLMAIMVGIMTSACIVSCDDKDKPEDTDETKTEKDFILGTWNFKNNYDERISITFFDNGTYAHCDYQDDDNYEGFYKLTSDLVVFTIVQGKDYTYNKSVKIIELSDDSFIFEGDDEGDVHGIIYDGLYKGTKERNIDEKTVVRYRKEIIGEWSITYGSVYGTETATLDIKDNGTFLFYDEDGYYRGTYSICDDKIMMLEDTQKCPIGGLSTIKELNSERFVFTNTYNKEIVGSK